jgi:hypothetical protein
MIEATYSSETSVDSQRNTRRYIAEYKILEQINGWGTRRILNYSGATIRYYDESSKDECYHMFRILHPPVHNVKDKGIKHKLRFYQLACKIFP